MPPRGKQAAKKQPATKMMSRSRSRSKPAAGATKLDEIKSSRDSANTNLDQSMKSAKSTKTTREEITPSALQAQHELEIQQAFGQITEQILSTGQEATAVTVVMKRTLVLLMRKSPALFQKTLLAFIERLITYEGDDGHLKNFHLLLTRLFHECVQERDRTNGTKLIKSVIRYLLDVYHLPKLLVKVQMKCGHMLALVLNATAAKPIKAANSAENDEETQPAAKQSRTFSLLDDNRHDEELRQLLEETTIQMLSSTKSTTMSQNQGISIASLISNYRDDRIFKQLTKLLVQSKSAETRKKIIKSLRLPYSAPALAFLGKRLRDENAGVVELVFDQLTQNGVTICQFPTPEARMLVLTEGFTASKETVRQKCIEFLKPTVLEYAAKNDIAGLLKLIEAKLAFGNQYFGRMPGLLTLVILEILEKDLTLAEYLERVVMRKIHKMAGISPSKKKASKATRGKNANDVELDEFDLALMERQEQAAVQDEEMISEKESEHEPDLEPLGNVNFEEILLLRLTYEINRSTKGQRSQAYLDKLEEIVPEYEDYRLITFALANMAEPCLPFIDPKVETIKPYPKGQVGFTRRAILGEWMKYSLQLNIQDEIIRKNLTTLCFELIGKIEYSFIDYEHLLKKKIQLLNTDSESANGAISSIVQACMNDEVGEANSDIEALLDEQQQKDSRMRQSGTIDDFQQEEENQSVEITIRTFENIGTARSLQEYCKPFAMETLTLDFDDVCQIAVTVAKTLLGDRIDEFQLKIMEAISDIKETIQDEASGAGEQKTAAAAGMFFSQLPQQPAETGLNASFGKLRDVFMKKVEQKVIACQSIGEMESNNDFDMDQFKKTFKQLSIFVELVEETNLKEKLSYKRALILCRSLLKQCRLANVHDQNVISICETLIHPAVLKNEDKENILLAFECIGLICILDKDVFLNYSKIFTEILVADSSLERENKREKVIAIKSVVDSLIIHGLSEDKFAHFFKILTRDYLTTKDRILRQVTIEGVCKMLFTTKLCDQNEQSQVESILAQLLFQQFDQKHNKQNSLVKSILKQFICNFVLFSEQRCHILLNALTKVTYSVLRERYGLDQQAAHVVKHVAKKGKKGAKPMKKVQKKGKQYSDYDDSDSEGAFSLSQDGYQSDDSYMAERKVKMRQVCSSVDFQQLCKILMVLLSRKYVNENNGEGGFKLKAELSLVFFQRLLTMNTTCFKKTQIVKDIMTPILETVSLESCDSLSQLRQMEQQWNSNAKLLLQSSAKISKFQDRLNLRMHELEEIEEANEQCSGSVVGRVKQEQVVDQDVEMNHSGARSSLNSPAAAVAKQGLQETELDGREDYAGCSEVDLETFWQEEIEDRVVDRGADDDRELLQMQQVWIDLTSKDSELLTNSAKKSILKFPSNFGMRLGGNQFDDLTPNASSQKKPQTQIRPKRSGRRQPAAKVSADSAHVHSKISTSLQPISEESGASKSARPRRVRIVEEKKEPRGQRTRGPVKSEISEEEEDEYDSEESNDEGTDRNDMPSHTDPSVTDHLESSESFSHLQEDSNLGRIARGVAKNFAAKNNSKRLSSSSAQSKLAVGESERWQQGKGMSKIKFEQPLAPTIKKEVLSDSKVTPQTSNRGLAAETMKKELIRDFDLADAEENPAPQKRGRMTTRNRRKGSQYSRSNSSNVAISADSDDDSEGMYDFMDGTLTKQMKKQKQQVSQRPQVKQEPLVKQEPPSSLDVSKSSIQSKSSMKTRKQRKIQQ